MRSMRSLQSVDSPSVEGAIDSRERQDSGLSSNNNGGCLHASVGEIKHLMERLNTAQVKVKRLNRLEAALVDFFMEVMNRSENNSRADAAVRSLEAESAFARGKRKEQFLKKAEGDPISLLNALRTHLRLQFTEQEAQQRAAERRAFSETANNQQKEQNTRNEFQQMELTCTVLKQQQEVLMRQLNQQKVDQTRSRRQHQALLEMLNTQLQAERSREQALQQIVTRQRQEIAALKEAGDALSNVSQTQKSQGSVGSVGATGAGSPNGAGCPAIPSATSATAPELSRSSSHASGDFFGTPAENQTLRRALRKYEIKMSRMEVANEERKREVQRLQQQLTGLRQNTQLQMYAQLEKESRHLREIADDLKKRNAESEADLLRTKGSLKEREIQVQKMKDEYARLFNAVQKQKQPSHYSPSKMSRTASTMHLTASAQSTQHLPTKIPNGGANETSSQMVDSCGTTVASTGEHPYVVEHYRSEAARVEREADALKLQIRRMMASEQLHKQKMRVLRADKQNLIRERDQLRADLERAARHSTLQSLAMTRQQTFSSVESRKGIIRDIPYEVKRLQKRNAFLEERFRKSMHSNSAFVAVGAVARLRNSMSISSGLGTKGGSAGNPEHEDFEIDNRGARSPCASVTSISKPHPASALSNKPAGNSFGSLDAATLQSLQQVKRGTRVRPQSAAPIK